MIRSNHKPRLPKPSSLASITDGQFVDCLMSNGPMSRAAIAEATGISKPTISESAQRLLKQALVVETERRSNGHQGRGGVLYDINANRGHSLGIALESGRVALRALNLKKDPIWEWSDTVSPTCTGTKLVSMLNSAIASCQQSVGTELLAAGFSVAAPVDPASGEVVPLAHSPFPLGHDIRFFEDFKINGHYPVVVDNDVNWATLAEHAYGCMQGTEDFLFVYIGTGIGAGLFLSGRLHRGVKGLAGEIGYLDYGSGKNLLHIIAGSDDSSLYETSLGEQRARELFSDTSEEDTSLNIVSEIAKTITISSTIMNPSAIVLGGPYIQFDTLYKRIKKQVEQNSLLPIIVERSFMLENAQLIGAATGAHELAMLSLGMRENPTSNDLPFRLI